MNSRSSTAGAARLAWVAGLGLLASGSGVAVLLAAIVVVHLSAPNLWFNATVRALEATVGRPWGSSVELTDHFGQGTARASVVEALENDGFRPEAGRAERYRTPPREPRRRNVQ